MTTHLLLDLLYVLLETLLLLIWHVCVHLQFFFFFCIVLLCYYLIFFFFLSIKMAMSKIKQNNNIFNNNNNFILRIGDLTTELEQIMKNSNPYIRKKVECFPFLVCFVLMLIRVVQRAPEIMPDYFKLAVQLLFSYISFYCFVLDFKNQFNNLEHLNFNWSKKQNEIK
ncbi:hypothetical protein RFI_12010 [Reticulomyxa filosa]|uniref:Uncharacterized protein n=1 Tax=Reticulomyxa filosa TaxID=46433 RepID=X6NIF3_RETFI|nr:hypothetical protein RFI_12010 [Reticulomyxa filosa]|eukprot:ETO25132.1 hypothetical protein RFI_12010 [Reticulomyxa filosa]